MNAQNLQSSVESAGQLELLVEDRYHQIGADGDPYLSLHRIGAGAIVVLDSQVTLDPAEEQLYAPAQLVKHGHGKCRNLQVVGQEDEFLVGLRIVVSDFPKENGKRLPELGESWFSNMVAEAWVFTFESGSFNPATDLLFTPVTPGIVRELSVRTISGRSYLARFSILPPSGGTTVPRLQLSITGSSSLKEIALRTSLPAGAVSVPYIYKFTANSSTTLLRFTTLEGDSATEAQVAGLQVAEPLTLPPSNIPNARQQAQIDRRYGLFLHFGINTFTGNEWGSGAESPSIYQPTALDVDQWVRTASEAGMRYVLMISKHYDGFCMWDSGWTTHDVGSSPVKTDILAAAAAACRKYGIQMAIYYSLWDRHEPTYTSPIDDNYNQYMQRQLTEFLGNYGPVCELWLDGAWEKNQHPLAEHRIV